MAEGRAKRIREHQRMVKAKQAKQERNARTKRLVETGAIVEKAHGGAYDDEGRQTFSDGLNGLTLPWLKPRDSCELGLLGFRRYV